jgi:hypothetical protein
VSTLRDYAGGNGQWGESGMIAEALRRMEIEPHFAVEFGAGDDIALLNTLVLAHAGVRCLWAEASWTRFSALSRLIDHLPYVAHHWVTVSNIDIFCGESIPDVLSIDVDGWDYDLFDGMTIRPPLVVIEHNPTVPSHIDWVGQGSREGASARALVRLANSKNYALVGATGANLIFVAVPYDLRFRDLETDLEVIFDRSQLNYVVSDYDGNWSTTGPWAFGRESEQSSAMEIRT